MGLFFYNLYGLKAKFKVPLNRSILYIILLYACILTLHYGIDRSDSIVLLTVYTVAFISYFLLLSDKKPSFKIIILSAIFIRVALFFTLPSLSDDFYRFIWDGRLLTQGLNSFDHKPLEIMSMGISIEGMDKLLFDNLNSQIYATIYPPISQLIFWTSAKFSTSIWSALTIMRFIILSFEIGTMVLLAKVLKDRKYRIAVYALNPLVILELTGNIHSEGIMLFFLVLGIFLLNKSYKYAALALSLSIATKLIPLMALPSLIRRIGFKKAIISYIIIGITSAILFYPLLSDAFIENFGASLKLFFQTFEFNSGIFFFARQIGFWVVGYDMVAVIGPSLSLLSLSIILYISFIRVRTDSNPAYWLVIIFFVQLIFSTTVHPWYVIPMLGLSVISGFRFPILWSLLIFYSYFGYTNDGYEQPMAIIYAEYLLVIGYALFEIIKKPQYLITHKT